MTQEKVVHDHVHVIPAPARRLRSILSCGSLPDSAHGPQLVRPLVDAGFVHALPLDGDVNFVIGMGRIGG